MSDDDLYGGVEIMEPAEHNLEEVDNNLGHDEEEPVEPVGAPPVNAPEEDVKLMVIIKKSAAVFMIFCCLVYPIIHFIVFFHNDVDENLGYQMGWTLVTMLVLTAFAGLLLAYHTNEDSISGMVAQRMNKISYMTILLIVGLSFYSSAFITAGGIARTRVCKKNVEWQIILASLSPILCSFILIFPLQVTKKRKELGIWEVHRNPNPGAGGYSQNENVITVSYWPCFGEISHAISHFISIFIGLSLGWTSIIAYLYQHFDHIAESGRILVVITLTISMTSIVFFFIFTMLDDEDNTRKTIRLVIELVGLYYHMICLLTLSTIAGQLIDLSPDEKHCN